MAVYLLSYDIASSNGFQYGPLWDKLDEMGAIKILNSEWLVVGPSDYERIIYNQIAPLTLKRDRLLVHEVTKQAFFDNLLISDPDF